MYRTGVHLPPHCVEIIKTDIQHSSYRRVENSIKEGPHEISIHSQSGEVLKERGPEKSSIIPIDRKSFHYRGVLKNGHYPSTAVKYFITEEVRSKAVHYSSREVIYSSRGILTTEIFLIEKRRMSEEEVDTQQ